MSDITSGRAVQGPPPRRTPSALDRANRQAQPAPAAPSPAEKLQSPEPFLVTLPDFPVSATSTIQQPIPLLASAPDEPQPVIARVEEVSPASVGASSNNDKLTFRLPNDLRERVRAVFRATRVMEGDEYFSEMLCRIIEQECVRRESVYNGGERFPEAGRLPRGRPFA